MKLKKPKVLHINTYDRAGGAEEFALSLATLNNDFLLVKKKMTDSDRVIEFKVNKIDSLFSLADKVLWKMGVKKKLRELFSWSDQFHFTFRKLSKLKEYIEADIIHLHNIHGGYFDLKSLLLIAEEKKIVWTIHDLWILTGGDFSVFDSCDFLSGQKTTGNSLMSINKNTRSNGLFRKKKYKKKLLIREIVNQSYLVFPGKTVHDLFTEYFHQLNKCCLDIIYCGVDCEIFKNLNFREWTIPRVLFFNSKSKFKNSNLVINELSEMSSEIELHSFGEPLGELNNFNNKVKLIDHGYIYDREELAALYNSVDILIYATLQENFPLTTIEAAMSGLTVLASNIPPIIEQKEIFAIETFDNNIQGDLFKKISELCENLNEVRAKGNRSSLLAFENLNRIASNKMYNALYREKQE